MGVPALKKYKEGRHGGVHLQSQHSGGWDRRILSTSQPGPISREREREKESCPPPFWAT
jgi:hypothetical protein